MTVGNRYGRRSSSVVFARVYPGRLTAGLLAATAFHLTVIIAVRLLVPETAGVVTLGKDIWIDRIHVATPRLLPPPSIGAPPKSDVVPRKAIPVAVPDESADRSARVPTEAEIAGGSESAGGAGSGEGLAGDEGPGGVEGGFDVPGGDEPAFEVVENPPVPIRQVTPAYPEVARLAGIEGTVCLRLLVDRNGKVAKVMVVKSDREVFNENAIAAAARWIFRPGETGGGPVAVWVSVPFRFRLNK